jgi:HD-like signal output (HDOD) protein
MSGVLRERLRGFLAFLRSRLLAEDVDTGRLSGLRQLADVRLRQFCIGKARVTGLDVAEFLADPRTGRFDSIADQGGLLKPGHLHESLEPLGEEMGYVVESCLLLQVVGPEWMLASIKDFVPKAEPLQEPAPAETAAASGPAPLPPPVERVLGSVKSLWAPPPNVVRILDLTSAPNAAPEPVAAEIEKDPPLAERFLRLANAAAPADSRSTSVRRAVIALGFPSIRRSALAAALVLRLGKARPEIEFDLSAFWTHALRVAHAAAGVARATRLGSPEDHFLAGLLHECGRLAFYQHHKDPFVKILGAVREGAKVEEAERKHLGTDHLAVGPCILERWRFAPGIAAAARHARITPAALEEMQLPREAVASAAMCQLANEASAASAWAPVLRLPAEQVEATRRESARLAERSALEVFGS